MDEIVDLGTITESHLKDISSKLNNLAKGNRPHPLFDRFILNKSGVFVVPSSSEVELTAGDAFYCRTVTVFFGSASKEAYKTIGVDLIVFDAQGNRTTIQAKGENTIDGCKVSYFDVDKYAAQINIKNTKSINIKIKEVSALGARVSDIDDRINDYANNLGSSLNDVRDLLFVVEQEGAKCVEKAKKEHRTLAELNSRLDAARKNKGEVDKKIEDQRKKLEFEQRKLSELEANIGIKEKEKEDVELTIVNLNLNLAGLSSVEAEMQSRIEEERRKQEALKKEGEVVQENVARLRSQEQLYSEDFSSIRSMFYSHGRLYFLLIILASSGALWLIARIYDAAIDIAIKADVANPVSILGLLVSRLPIALVNILVVGALIKLIWVLVVRLLDNNNSLAEMNQMAYLVRESVEEHKEDFKDESSESKQRMRTQMKTSLIRDFMCGESQRKSEGSNDMTKTGGGIELSKFTDALQEFIKLAKPDTKNQ